ncbi:glycoside hydrolase family 18 protein [Tylopilus felleus]
MAVLSLLGSSDCSACPAAPRFVVYGNAWVNPLPNPTELKGYNVSSYLIEYKKAGISLIISSFGFTETPTSSGKDAVTVGNDLAKRLKQYGIEGIDVDYEDLSAFNSTAAEAEAWLISLTQTLRKELPQGQYILTHAQVEWRRLPASTQSVGSMIDWYNIQLGFITFSAEGTSEYTTCDGLLTASSSTWPETALFQIAADGVNKNKFVIGKPAKQSDASSGYMSTSDLAECVSQAHAKGWGKFDRPPLKKWHVK